MKTWALRSFPAPGRAMLCLISGAVAGLGQAPWSLWFIAPVAFAACIYFFKLSATRGAAAWVGWIFGLGYFAISLFWIVEPFLVDLARHGWMAPFALVFLSGGLALLWAVAFAFAQRIGILGLIVIWTAMELLRAWLFTGFPWATIGHIWIDSPVLQLASLGGAGLLTFLMLLIAALPILFHPKIGAPAALVLLAVCLAYGTYLLPEEQDPLTDKTVRLVQPNAEQRLKWDPEHVNGFFHKQLNMTSAEGAPDLVIWPETSIAWRFDRAGEAFAMIAEAAGPTQVIFGGNDLVDEKYHNTLAVMQDGQITRRYYKHHLVPFGEYVPFAELLGNVGIRGLAARDGAGYEAGDGPEVIEIEGIGRVLPLICYELIFPRHLRAVPRPDVILQITNDAWFGNISGPYQHLAQARLRAVEQGLPVMRAANTGISAMIDGHGRVLAQLPLNTDGYLDVALPEPLWATPYAILGDWPVRLSLTALLIGLLIVRRRLT